MRKTFKTQWIAIPLRAAFHTFVGPGLRTDAEGGGDPHTFGSVIDALFS
jgi:hypothetical protein